MQDERCTWQDDLATLTDAKFATEPHGSLSICTKQPYENLLHKPISGDNLALKLGSDGLRVRWRFHTRNHAALRSHNLSEFALKERKTSS